MGAPSFGGGGAGPRRLSWECASGWAACGSARVFGPLSGVAAPDRGSLLLPAGGGPVGCERPGLLSEIADRIGEDLLERDPLGAQLVHAPPARGVREGAL